MSHDAITTPSAGASSSGVWASVILVCAVVLLSGCSAAAADPEPPYRLPGPLQQCSTDAQSRSPGGGAALLARAAGELDNLPPATAVKNVPIATLLFQQALATADSSSVFDCARLGLTTLRDNPPGTVAPKSPAARFGKLWSDYAKNNLVVLGPILGTFAGTLAVLWVLAGVAARYVVGRGDQTWSSDARRAASVIGWFLIGLAAAWPVAVAVSPIPDLVLTPQWLWIAVGVIGSTVSVYMLVRACAGSRPRTDGVVLCTGWSVVGSLAIYLIAASIFAALRGTPALVALGVAVAVGGLVLLAASGGQALRAVVAVVSAGGVADAGAAAYLTRRLYDLGSGRQPDIEIPRNTDVSSLPSTAISALPNATLVKLLTAAVTIVRPGVPWQIDVTVHGPDELSVTLRRNGQPVGSVQTFDRAALGLPATGADAQVKTAETQQLLTAAAAHVLLELSKRHRELRDGLGGATSSHSLARFAIATDPVSRLDAETKSALLTAAVADDPQNWLARIANINRLDKTRDRQTRLQVAQEAQHVLDRLRFLSDAQVPGVRRLVWRLSFTTAAAWTNVHLGGQPALPQVHTAILNLVNELSESNDGGELMRSLRSATWYLADTARKLSVDRIGDHRASKAPEAWRILPPEGPYGAYHQACWQATPDSPRSPLPNLRIAKITENLRLATTDADLRIWARRDPSFDRVRKHPQLSEYLAPPPPIDALTVEPLIRYQDKLATIGIRSGSDLLLVPSEQLAEALKIPVAIATHWREIAGGIGGTA